MKRTVIYNLVTRSFVGGFEDGRWFFLPEHTKAFNFGTKDFATQTLVEEIIPHETQVNKDNFQWEVGFALTVLEVFV